MINKINKSIIEMGICCTKKSTLLTETHIVQKNDNYYNRLFRAIIKKHTETISSMVTEDLEQIVNGMPLIHWLALSSITTKYKERVNQMVQIINSYKKYHNIRIPRNTFILYEKDFTFVIYKQASRLTHNIENLTVPQFIDELLRYIKLINHTNTRQIIINNLIYTKKHLTN